MMRLGVIAAALLALPTGLQAANCTSQWTAINDLLVRTGRFETPLPGIVREGADGSCRIDGVDIPVDQRLRIAADRVQWTGTNMDRFVSDGLPPTALTLSVEGITINPDLGDRTLSYLNRIQNRGRTIDLLFDADWSATDRRLSLNALNLSFPEDDHVHFNAEIDGVDLTTRNTIVMSAGSMAITRAVTDIRSTRLFQDYLLQPLGFSLLYRSDDPEARVAELKDMARGYIAMVPQDILPQSSQAALLMLLEEMPDPSGRLIIEKTATPGIGPARFATLAMRRGGIKDSTQIFAALKGLVVNITFEPQ